MDLLNITNGDGNKQISNKGSDNGIQSKVSENNKYIVNLDDALNEIKTSISNRDYDGVPAIGYGIFSRLSELYDRSFSISGIDISTNDIVKMYSSPVDNIESTKKVVKALSGKDPSDIEAVFTFMEMEPNNENTTHLKKALQDVASKKIIEQMNKDFNFLSKLNDYDKYTTKVKDSNKNIGNNKVLSKVVDKKAVNSYIDKLFKNIKENKKDIIDSAESIRKIVNYIDTSSVNEIKRSTLVDKNIRGSKEKAELFVLLDELRSNIIKVLTNRDIVDGFEKLKDVTNKTIINVNNVGGDDSYLKKEVYNIITGSNNSEKSQQEIENLFSAHISLLKDINKKIYDVTNGNIPNLQSFVRYYSFFRDFKDEKSKTAAKSSIVPPSVLSAVTTQAVVTSEPTTSAITEKTSNKLPELITAASIYRIHKITKGIVTDPSEKQINDNRKHLITDAYNKSDVFREAMQPILNSFVREIEQYHRYKDRLPVDVRNGIENITRKISHEADAINEYIFGSISKYIYDIFKATEESHSNVFSKIKYGERVTDFDKLYNIISEYSNAFFHQTMLGLLSGIPFTENIQNNITRSMYISRPYMLSDVTMGKERSTYETLYDGISSTGMILGLASSFAASYGAVSMVKLSTTVSSVVRLADLVEKAGMVSIANGLRNMAMSAVAAKRAVNAIEFDKNVFSSVKFTTDAERLAFYKNAVMSSTALRSVSPYLSSINIVGVNIERLSSIVGVDRAAAAIRASLNALPSKYTAPVLKYFKNDVFSISNIYASIMEARQQARFNTIEKKREFYYDMLQGKYMLPEDYGSAFKGNAFEGMTTEDAKKKIDAQIEAGYKADFFLNTALLMLTNPISFHSVFTGRIAKMLGIDDIRKDVRFTSIKAGSRNIPKSKIASYSIGVVTSNIARHIATKKLIEIGLESVSESLQEVYQDLFSESVYDYIKHSNINDNDVFKITINALYDSLSRMPLSDEESRYAYLVTAIGSIGFGLITGIPSSVMEFKKLNRDKRLFIENVSRLQSKMKGLGFIGVVNDRVFVNPSFSKLLHYVNMLFDSSEMRKNDLFDEIENENTSNRRNRVLYEMYNTLSDMGLLDDFIREHSIGLAINRAYVEHIQTLDDFISFLRDTGLEDRIDKNIKSRIIKIYSRNTGKDINTISEIEVLDALKDRLIKSIDREIAFVSSYDSLKEEIDKETKSIIDGIPVFKSYDNIDDNIYWKNAMFASGFFLNIANKFNEKRKDDSLSKEDVINAVLEDVKDPEIKENIRTILSYAYDNDKDISKIDDIKDIKNSIDVEQVGAKRFLNDLIRLSYDGIRDRVEKDIKSLLFYVKKNNLMVSDFANRVVSIEKSISDVFGKEYKINDQEDVIGFINRSLQDYTSNVVESFDKNRNELLGSNESLKILGDFFIDFILSLGDKDIDIFRKAFKKFATPKDGSGLTKEQIDIIADGVFSKIKEVSDIDEKKKIIVSLLDSINDISINILSYIFDVLRYNAIVSISQQMTTKRIPVWGVNMLKMFLSIDSDIPVIKALQSDILSMIKAYNLTKNILTFDYIIKNKIKEYVDEINNIGNFNTETIKKEFLFKELLRNINSNASEITKILQYVEEMMNNKDNELAYEHRRNALEILKGLIYSIGRDIENLKKDKKADNRLEETLDSLYRDIINLYDVLFSDDIIETDIYDSFIGIAILLKAINNISNAKDIKDIEKIYDSLNKEIKQFNRLSGTINGILDIKTHRLIDAIVHYLSDFKQMNEYAQLYRYIRENRMFEKMADSVSKLIDINILFSPDRKYVYDVPNSYGTTGGTPETSTDSKDITEQDIGDKSKDDGQTKTDKQVNTDEISKTDESADIDKKAKDDEKAKIEEQPKTDEQTNIEKHTKPEKETDTDKDIKTTIVTETDKDIKESKDEKVTEDKKIDEETDTKVKTKDTKTTGTKKQQRNKAKEIANDLLNKNEESTKSDETIKATISEDSGIKEDKEGIKEDKDVVKEDKDNIKEDKDKVENKDNIQEEHYIVEGIIEKTILGYFNQIYQYTSKLATKRISSKKIKETEEELKKLAEDVETLLIANKDIIDKNDKLRNLRDKFYNSLFYIKMKKEKEVEKDNSVNNVEYTVIPSDTDIDEMSNNEKHINTLNNAIEELENNKDIDVEKAIADIRNFVDKYSMYLNDISNKANKYVVKSSDKQEDGSVIEYESILDKDKYDYYKGIFDKGMAVINDINERISRIESSKKDKEDVENKKSKKKTKTTASDKKQTNKKQDNTKNVDVKKGDEKQKGTKQDELKQSETKKDENKPTDAKQEDNKIVDAKQEDNKQEDTKQDDKEQGGIKQDDKKQDDKKQKEPVIDIKPKEEIDTDKDIKIQTKDKKGKQQKEDKEINQQIEEEAKEDTIKEEKQEQTQEEKAVQSEVVLSEDELRNTTIKYIEDLYDKTKNNILKVILDSSKSNNPKTKDIFNKTIDFISYMLLYFDKKVDDDVLINRLISVFEGADNFVISEVISRVGVVLSKDKERFNASGKDKIYKNIISKTKSGVDKNTSLKLLSLSRIFRGC